VDRSGLMFQVFLGLISKAMLLEMTLGNNSVVSSSIVTTFVVTTVVVTMVVVIAESF
jgi:hypothetical protein